MPQKEINSVFFFAKIENDQSNLLDFWNILSKHLHHNFYNDGFFGPNFQSLVYNKSSSIKT